MRSTTIFSALLLLFSPAVVGAQDFTVVSANLWKSGTQGFNVVTQAMPLGKALALPAARTFLRQTVGNGYGVVGMQEVDDLSYKLMGYGYAYRFQGNTTFYGRPFGNAVATNAKIVKTQSWKFTFDPNNPQFGGQQRGAIAVKLDFYGKRLWFVDVHLAPHNPVAMRQVWQLMGRIKTFDPDFPVIVVGDFNIRNRAPWEGQPEKTYHELATVFGNLSGFRDVSLHRATVLAAPPATTVDGQLDYVFLYDPNNRLQVLGCSAQYVYTYPYVASDHKAVVARFRWR